MASLDDILRGDLAKGVALGIGAALLLPVAASALAPVLRPAARTALKAGVLAFERGRETLAELGELVEDMVAETQAELRAARDAADVQTDAAAAACVDPDAPVEQPAASDPAPADTAVGSTATTAASDKERAA